MEIINFEDAKARKQSKTRKRSKVKTQSKQHVTKYLPEADDSVSELQRQYREYARFCNQWYADHVIGQDKDGRWIYKDL
ncbi:MAG: hypothetical protein K2N95_10195 [Lachnospiraceae bacterium]|nr:hypothetical protein [Lachnospiraceae bacterium]